jgi:tetratricopeptide (TPR) repeat protein
VDREGRGSRALLRVQGSDTPQYHPQLDKVCSLSSGKASLPCWLYLLLLFVSGTALLSQSSPDRPKSLHGSITVAPGQSAAGVAVELWGLRGTKLASSITDRTGSFEIAGPKEPGEYILLVDSGFHIKSQQVRLADSAIELNLILPASDYAAHIAGRYMVSAQQAAVPARARASLRSAQKRFREAKVNEALKEIDNALHADPDFARALTMRAFLQLAAKNPNGAVEDAKHAILLDPSDAESFVALAMAYNDVENYGDAGQAAERALDLRSDSWQGRLELAESFYGRHDFVVALRELDLAEIDFPDAHLVRGNVLLKLGRPTEAGEEFQTFVQEAPNDPRRQQVDRLITQYVGVSAPANVPDRPNSAGGQNSAQSASLFK